MADIVDLKTRSRMMAGIRARDTKPEIVVRKYLHSRGLRFRLHYGSLPGRPDIVLPKFEAVVEVRGCYWHQHQGCKWAYTPKSNVAFWQKKFAGNRRRDRVNERLLREDGWKVIVVWECEVHHQVRLKSVYEQILDGSDD